MAHTKRINEAHEGGQQGEGKPKRMHKLIVASVAGASSGGGGVPCRSRVGGRVLVKGTGYGYACRTHATGYTHAHTHRDRHTHAGCRKTLGKVNLLMLK